MAVKAAAEYMQRAIDLAVKGRGRTTPNPLVGAVIVKGGRIVGEGYHRRAGQAHAEVQAIKQAGSKSRGGMLFTNLEPCCHFGKTGPCSEAIIKAGLKAVYFSIRDPNPLVKGKGAKALREAGIEVSSGLLASQSRLINELYLGYYQSGRPYVVLKIAQSIDGRVATRSGDSKWITGKESRKFAHSLRSQVDAIVIGAGTALEDNPKLTVRHVKGVDPYRIIVTTKPDKLSHLRLLKDNADARTIIATTSVALEKESRKPQSQNITYWALKGDRQGKVSVDDLVEKADQFGIRSLMIEGGPTLATSFIKSKLVDKFVIMTAPILIGEGKSSISDLGVNSINKARSIHYPSVRRLGDDIVVTGYSSRGRR